MFLPFRGVCPAFTECSGRWGQREEASRGSVRQALVQEACLGRSSEALEVLQARRQPSSRCEHAHPTTCVFSWGWPSLLPPSSLPVWQPVWRQAWAVLSGPPRGRAARLPHLLFVPGCCDRSQPRAFVGSSQSKILPMPRGPLLKPEAKGPWLSLQKGFVETRLAPKMCPWHGGPPGGPLALDDLGPGVQTSLGTVALLPYPSSPLGSVSAGNRQGVCGTSDPPFVCAARDPSSTGVTTVPPARSLAAGETEPHRVV